jgi:hypothetical protein
MMSRETPHVQGSVPIGNVVQHSAVWSATTSKSDWNQYQVVVMNYHTGMRGTPPAWPEETCRGFERCVSHETREAP